MKDNYVIGIDYGTESGRVMLVRVADGEEIAWSVVPYANGVMDRQLPDGTPLGHDWALQDPRDYLTVLQEGVPEVMREAGAAPDQVLGIGTDFTACTILPTLRDGTPLSTLAQYAANPHAWVKLWKHHAAQPEAVRINEIGAARNEPVMRMYNGRYSSEWFFSKVLQIVDEAPEIYAAAERIVEAADWIVWQMTGQLRANECTAGYKDMWTKGAGYPSPEFFRALDPRLENVVAEKLSTEFYLLGSSAGGLTSEMAALTGLKAGTPVAVGNIDAHVAVPACGVVKPGVLCMIMGTSLCHMLMAHEQHFVEGVAGVVQDGIVPGFWGYEAGQAAVGDIYAWFFRAFGANPDEVTAKAAKLKPGQSGLVALDWWNGNRSVLMDADLTGLIVGHDTGHAAGRNLSRAHRSHRLRHLHGDQGLREEGRAHRATGGLRRIAAEEPAGYADFRGRHQPYHSPAALAAGLGPGRGHARRGGGGRLQRHRRSGFEDGRITGPLLHAERGSARGVREALRRIHRPARLLRPRRERRHEAA